MQSMTVTRDPSDPRIIVVADGDESERSMWINGEITHLVGRGVACAHVRLGMRIDDPADPRNEAEIRTDPAFEAIYIEV